MTLENLFSLVVIMHANAVSRIGSLRILSRFIIPSILIYCLGLGACLGFGLFAFYIRLGLCLLLSKTFG